MTISLTITSHGFGFLLVREVCRFFRKYDYKDYWQTKDEEQSDKNNPENVHVFPVCAFTLLIPKWDVIAFMKLE